MTKYSVVNFVRPTCYFCHKFRLDHTVRGQVVVMRGSLLAVYVIWDSPASLSFYVFLSLSRPPGLHSHNGDSRRPNLVSDSKRVWCFVLRTGWRKASFSLLCRASPNMELKFKDLCLLFWHCLHGSYPSTHPEIGLFSEKWKGMEKRKGNNWAEVSWNNL